MTHDDWEKGKRLTINNANKSQLKWMIKDRDQRIKRLYDELEKAEAENKAWLKFNEDLANKLLNFDPFTTALQHLVPMTAEDKPHLIKGIRLLEQAMDEFSNCSDYDDDRICQAHCYAYNMVAGYLVAYAEGKQLYEIDGEAIEAYFANPDEMVN